MRGAQSHGLVLIAGLPKASKKGFRQPVFLKDMKKFKKYQSIFEYILVTVVFTIVGVGTFFATLKSVADRRAGFSNSNYYSKDTDIGKIVNTGVNKEELRWPSKFGQYSSDAEGYSGTIEEAQIAEPDPNKGYTYGEPLGKFYKFNLDNEGK